MSRFRSLILLVLLRVEVAAKWIEGFDHPIDCAERYRFHIRLFHVVGFDPGKNFAVNTQMGIRTVRGSPAPPHGSKQEQRYNARRGGDNGKLKTSVHWA